MYSEKVLQKVLGKDERLEHSFSIGGRYINFGLIVSGLFLLLLLLVFGKGFFPYFLIFFAFAFFYFAFYFKLANVYAFTDRRVVIHRGWLSTHSISVDYSKITDIRVIDPFFKRIITRTGYLAINTAGSHNVEIILKHVERPYELKKILEDLKDRALSIKSPELKTEEGA